MRPLRLLAAARDGSAADGSGMESTVVKQGD